MWRLTIDRKFECEIDGKTYPVTHSVYCESENLGELTLVVEALKPHAVEGEYRYEIKNV